jgi:hypothetical protein
MLQHIPAHKIPNVVLALLYHAQSGVYVGLEPRRSDHFPPFFVLSVAHPIFAPFGAHIWCEHL